MRTSHRLINCDEEVEAALLEQHLAIHAAIIARDPDRARLAAERHLQYVRMLYEWLV